MKKTNLHQAKTNLSKLVELAAKGEEVIICKAGEPVAKLVAFRPKKKARKGGAWEGKGTIAKDFDVLPPEFMRYFK
jgi:prevent-host-death family protein